MKKVKFIYNPHSGETLVPTFLDEIIGLYQRKLLSVVPYRLTFDGNPIDIVSDLDESYHHILIAGGDGTVNYVVNLMKQYGIDIPVAILPTGTANDFASVLGMPASIPQACRKILEGEIRSVDLGRVNGSYFVNVFSCGLFSDVSQKTPTILKNTFGRLAYYVGGLGEIAKLRKMHITIASDRGEYDGSSLMFLVFNGQTAGKFKLAYLSEIDDGLLDVLIIKGDSPLETIQTILHYLSRLGINSSDDYPPGVIHFQCSRLTDVSALDEATDMDGQAGPHFPLEISCQRGGLKVICPRRDNL